MSSLSLAGKEASKAVAEDFAESLRDLTQNNRYEISNLTIIAKENTEHAQAISKALVEHIKTTHPASKLPALYVLDSIVKNVGTPYTVYIGRNLYSIFMDAYTLVDSNLRRAMEGMLKTWKEAVPGSMDKRSVFPPEVVRPIENALIKAKTAALQHQRVPAHGGYRATPTPPQSNGQFAPPPGSFQQGQGFHSQQHTPQPPFQHTPVQQQAFPFAQPPQAPPGPDLEAIKRDLVGVIARTQGEFASNPSDAKVQQKMQALLDLQRVLNTTQLPPQSLQAIATQISQLAVPAPRPTPPAASTPQWQPPQPAAPPMQLPFQQPPPFVQPPSTQTPPFFQLPPPSQMPALNPAQLSSLAALMQNTQKPSTPQIRAAAPALENASHNTLHNIQSHQAATSAQPQNGSDLLSSLMKAGLMKPPSTASPPAAAPPPPAAPPSNDLASLIASLSSRAPSQAATPSFPSAIPTRTTGKPHIPPTNSALKTFRPELLRPLYADLSNQCSTCGRRFPPTPSGREKKSRHLDWHFRINQRLAETSRAAHHRHWFPDAVPWIEVEDFDASTASAEDVKGDKGKEVRERKAEDLWVRAPGGVTKVQCPICYEEMRSSHPEELQDWVFRNAVWNQGRICHGTCLAEMSGGVLPQLQAGGGSRGGGGAGVGGGSGGNGVGQAPQGSLAAVLAGLTGQGQAQREGSRTPDSSLGKRKAEEAGYGAGAGKMRREG